MPNPPDSEGDLSKFLFVFQTLRDNEKSTKNKKESDGIKYKVSCKVIIYVQL